MRTSSSTDGAPAPGRRTFLASLAASIAGACLGGCSSSLVPPSAAEPDALSPLVDGPLDAMLPLAGLRWVMLLRPRQIATIPWLIPPIATLVPEDRFQRFADASGLDLRQVLDAAIATYASDDGEVPIYLVRHGGDASAIERAFRKRLTSDERRVVDRPDLVRVSGKIGGAQHAFAAIGRDVVAFQPGGRPDRGPLRIATLYAMKKLSRSPTLLAEDPLRALAKRFGAAPAKALTLGPFEGELARGARGLLGAATALGASARASVREWISLTIAVLGDFSRSGRPAAEELLMAWTELSEGSFGRLLGLDTPMEAALCTYVADAVTLNVELNPRLLAKGLANATRNQIDEIMR